MMGLSSSTPFFIAGALVMSLFVNPKSPLRKHCYQIPGKLGVQIVNDGRNNINVSGEYLTIYLGLRAIVDIKVDKVDLKIGHKKPLPSDWKPRVIQGDETRYINFQRPSWLGKGKHQAYLVAYTPEGFSKSNRFIVETGSEYEG